MFEHCFVFHFCERLWGDISWTPIESTREESALAGHRRDGKMKNGPTEATGSILACGWEGKMEILASSRKQVGE